MGKPESEDHNDQRSENNPTPVDHSLDDLAKELASGTVSRRRALRMLGAALVGGVLASVPGVAWAKPKPGKCTRDAQCPSGQRCVNRICADECASTLDCRPQGAGSICCGGTCIRIDANNCGACGNACPAGSDCCLVSFNDPTTGQPVVDTICCPGGLSQCTVEFTPEGTPRAACAPLPT
jgi:Dickkopf N-terminal cysteine-rich region